MTSTPLGSELGKVHKDVLIRAYNLRISYPNKDIAIHANDVRLCFLQIKHHPDVMGAVSFILADYLFFQVGLTFGTGFSPANWEAVCRIQSALAENLFSNISLVKKTQDRS